MLTALVLLAAIDAAPTPAAISTPAPVKAAANGQTRTLADVARERKLTKRPAGGGTLSVSGGSVSAAPVSQTSGAPVAKPAIVADEEAVWRHRNADARGELAAAQVALPGVGAVIALPGAAQSTRQTYQAGSG
jgi:hypothetical protein